MYDAKFLFIPNKRVSLKKKFHSKPFEIINLISAHSFWKLSSDIMLLDMRGFVNYLPPTFSLSPTLITNMPLKKKNRVYFEK